jgi:hypothetical protein
MFGPAFSENDVCDMLPDSGTRGSTARRPETAGRALRLVAASPRIRALKYPYAALHTAKITRPSHLVCVGV